MTQHEKIIAIMATDCTRWWHAEELIGYGKHFVGYEAAARVTELAKWYPDMIASMPSSKHPRQKVRRFRAENSQTFLPLLPDKLRKFVEGVLKDSGHAVHRRVQRTEYTPNGVRVWYEYLNDHE